MSELYADASALAKLVLDEDESEGLRRFLGGDGRSLSSSALVRVEVARAVRIRRPTAAPTLREVLERVTLVAVGDRVLAEASRLVKQELRSLDAIHLATALLLEVGEMLVYDRRLAEAAEEVGIRTLAPGR